MRCECSPRCITFPRCMALRVCRDIREDGNDCGRVLRDGQARCDEHEDDRRRRLEQVEAMREVVTAAHCYFTCTGIPCTKDDLAMCRENLNRALLAERETRSP